MAYREQDVFVWADEALVKIVEQIKDNQWGIKAPAEMSWKGPMTVRELINYHAYDDVCVPKTLAGKKLDEPSHKMEEDFLNDDPKGNFKRIADQAIEAVRNFPDSELDKTVHLSYGDFPVREYLKHITNYRGFRVVDFARLLGLNDQLDDNLVRGLWEENEPMAEDLRKMHVFGPEVKVPADAPLQERLLGLSGRQPRQKP